MHILIRMWNDVSGSSAAEYALILAIIGSALAAATIFLGNAIAAEMNDTADCIRSEGSC